MKHFCIEIDAVVDDSVLLWKLIEKYHVNLMQCENKIWVYGDTNETNVGKIISICCLLGSSLKVELSNTPPLK